MTREQDLIAEKILQLHKEKNGLLSWFSLYNVDNDYLFAPGQDDEQKAEQLDLIKAALLEIALIDILHPEGEGDKTRLTEKGYGFRSFKKLKRDQYIEDFPKKKWPIVGIVVYSAGLFSGLIAPRMLKAIWPDTNQSTPTIPASEHNPQNIPHLVPYDSLHKNK